MRTKSTCARKCPVFHQPIRKDGKTRQGRQRWKCADCDLHTTVRRKDAARRARLEEFPVWLLGAVGRPAGLDERVRRCNICLQRLARSRELFRFLDPALADLGPLPCTSNRLGGGIDLPLKRMSGMPGQHMLRACEWMCQKRSEPPLPPSAACCRAPPPGREKTRLATFPAGKPVRNGSSCTRVPAYPYTTDRGS